MNLTKQQFHCKHSNLFKNNSHPRNDVYYVEKLGYLVFLSRNTDLSKSIEDRLIFAIKGKATREKIDMFELMEITPKICAFCGKRNNLWTLDLTVSCDRVITINNIKYRPNKHHNFCYEISRKTSIDRCPGKLLNPNSREFIAKTRGVSNEEALKIIHSRNKSPFYAGNHSSQEEYAEFQRTRFYGRPLEMVQKGITKIAETRAKNEESKIRSGWSSITREDGHLLRSNGERFFYRYAKEIGIADDIVSNGFYENSILSFDFFFPKLKLYVEISGINEIGYNERIKEKQKKFGCIVLRRNRYFNEECKTFLNSVKQQLEELKEK